MFPSDHLQRAWRTLAFLPFLFCCFTGTVSAHPMGNFSINHLSEIEVSPTFVRVSYIIDMAEIPAFQEMQEHGLSAQPDDPLVITYRDRKIEEFRQGLELRLDGRSAPLATKTRALNFPPGAGGLPTMRFSAMYEAPLDALSGDITYEDRNYPQRVGWKEITANAREGAVFSAVSAQAESKSHRLTNYAENLLLAPPQELRATLTFDIPPAARLRAAASPATVGSSAPERTENPTSKNLLTELITARQLSAGVVVFALLVAIGLGAFHALEPGHGKTLVAAYLVGSQGTAWHALILGLTVTVSHTIGVYALGGVALFASHYVVPEQLYPWLGLMSGLLITGMGLVLFGRALEGQVGHGEHRHEHHDHSHDHHHDHSHGHDHANGHGHSHGGAHHHPHASGAAVGYGSLLTLGITGGLIPCPAALVVLLSAVALQRIAFGLLLIVAFSIGLAAVLVGTGLLFVSARGVMRRWSGEGRWLEYLPFLSPLVMTPLGVMIATRSLLGIGLAPGLSF